MLQHPTISALMITGGDTTALSSLFSYLELIPHIDVSVNDHLPEELGTFDLVITTNVNTDHDTDEALNRFVEAGGGWLTFVHLSVNAVPPIFGVQPEPAGPPVELRILFEDRKHPLAARLPDAIYLKGRYHVLTKTAEDSETLLYTDWQYSHKTVLAGRQWGKGRVACTTLQDYGNAGLQRILYRLVWQLAGRKTDPKDMGIGILGYAPSVGPLHGIGTEKTSGLSLRAICDSNPERLTEARSDFAEAKTYESANQLVDDPEVDLVIIATPPNSHADLCLQMMAGGKHVVCEKPLALNRQETDALVEMADKRGLHLSCHQNRRWDPDFLAIRQVLMDGLIGDLFYLESFVGGYHHPCGYWHSDARISGGTSYDWGAHYLDWIVALMPQKIKGIIGTRHKRVWHDVTNADQERIQIRFDGGKEAEFMHSDIAARRKPKWYLLGHEGAIIGQWRDVKAYEIDPILYYRQHDIPATEMTPKLTVQIRNQNGDIIGLNPSIPAREPYPFHGNLADHLLWGEPIMAPLEDSVKVVGILEAAARSMANGGTVERMHDGSN